MNATIVAERRRRILSNDGGKTASEAAARAWAECGGSHSRVLTSAPHISTSERPAKRPQCFTSLVNHFQCATTLQTLTEHFAMAIAEQANENHRVTDPLDPCTPSKRPPPNGTLEEAPPQPQLRQDPDMAATEKVERNGFANKEETNGVLKESPPKRQKLDNNSSGALSVTSSTERRKGVAPVKPESVVLRKRAVMRKG